MFLVSHIHSHSLISCRRADVERLFSSLDFQPGPPSARFLPSLPLEVIHHIADTFLPVTVDSESKTVGHSISLVCRSWRSIGQSLLFHHLSIRSLAESCPRLQHLLSPSFSHARRVKLLLVDVTSCRHPVSTLRPLLDRCCQLSEVALYGPPKNVSHNLRDLALSPVRHTLKTLAIAIEQVAGQSFEERDVDGFLYALGSLSALEDLQIQIPVSLGRLLSPAQYRIKVAKFSLCICSSEKEEPKEADFEHTSLSILSLLSHSHLKELKLLPASSSQAFVDSLPLHTSLSSMTLVSFNRSPTHLIKSLLPVLSSLVPLRYLSIRAMEEEEEEENPVNESTTSTFLRLLSPHLKTLDLDYSVNRSTSESIEGLLLNSREGALKRVTWVENSQGKRIYQRRVKKSVEGLGNVWG